MTAPVAEGQRRIALAAVAGAHGLKGELRLKLFGEGAESLSRHQTVFLAGAARRLLSVKAAGKAAIARFEGVASRSAAEALRGSLVEVARDSLPPLDDDEYYHSDLIGLPCVDATGGIHGSVVAVENFGAGDLLEVENPSGRRALIPFKPGTADVEGAQIVIDPDFLA